MKSRSGGSGFITWIWFLVFYCFKYDEQFFSSKILFIKIWSFISLSAWLCLYILIVFQMYLTFCPFSRFHWMCRQRMYNKFYVDQKKRSKKDLRQQWNAYSKSCILKSNLPSHIINNSNQFPTIENVPCVINFTT